MVTLTIIGAGNCGHVCAALASGNGVKSVNLITSEPHIFSKHPVAVLPDGSRRTGVLDCITSNPADVVPQSDIILWTGPVHPTISVFKSIAPHLKPGAVVGTIFAQGLVHLAALRLFKHLGIVRFFALRNVPWICRVETKGSLSNVLGPKKLVEVAMMNLSEEWLQTVLEPIFYAPDCPRLTALPDFCPVVFNPANQIIHPAAYSGVFRDYQGKPMAELPARWLYRDMDAESSEVLSRLDAELQRIKDVFYEKTGMEGCKAVVPLHERLKQQYGSQIKDSRTVGTSVASNEAYSQAQVPFKKVSGGVEPDPGHRVFKDDIPNGLCVLISIAKRLGVETPQMIDMVCWHQQIMGKSYIVDGELVGKDCKDLSILQPEDDLEVVGGVQSMAKQAETSRL